MTMRRIVILGATSKIAHEIARAAARDGKEFLLLARHGERLQAVAGDLRARGAARVDTLAADLADAAAQPELWDQVEQAMPDFDAVLLAYGSLADQAHAEASPEYTLDQLNVNFTSAAGLLTRAAISLEKRAGHSGKNGLIAVICSVAGDRARRSNYVYGAAKGALALYAQGLRARLLRYGVRVLTIKPGPVDTPMTAGMKLPLLAPAESVGRKIYREMEHGRRDVLYVPGVWRPIMFLIRALPEAIVKRLRM